MGKGAALPADLSGNGKGRQVLGLQKRDSSWDKESSDVHPGPVGVAVRERVQKELALYFVINCH